MRLRFLRGVEVVNESGLSLAEIYELIKRGLTPYSGDGTKSLLHGTQYEINNTNKSRVFELVKVSMFLIEELEQYIGTIVLSPPYIVWRETEGVVNNEQSVNSVDENPSRSATGDNDRNLSKNNKIDPRIRNSYLKIIAAALCPKGDITPVEERGLAKKFEGRLQTLGLPLSEQTIKNILKEVANFARENSPPRPTKTQ